MFPGVIMWLKNCSSNLVPPLMFHSTPTSFFDLPSPASPPPGRSICLSREHILATIFVCSYSYKFNSYISRGLLTTFGLLYYIRFL